MLGGIHTWQELLGRGHISRAREGAAWLKHERHTTREARAAAAHRGSEPRQQRAVAATGRRHKKAHACTLEREQHTGEAQNTK